MDCYNHLCSFRQNTTSNCNRCECLACQNREKEFVTYIVSNQTLTADEIARMTNNPDYGVGPDVRRWSDMENLLQNIASVLWIVLGVYCFFVLTMWNKRFSDLYDELKGEVE